MQLQLGAYTCSHCFTVYYFNHIFCSYNICFSFISVKLMQIMRFSIAVMLLRVTYCYYPPRGHKVYVQMTGAE